MTASLTQCPACNYDLPDLGAMEPLKVCPSCGHRLTDDSGPVELNSAAMKPFSVAAPELYERIRNVAPEASWHLAVIAEIVDYEYKRLNKALNETEVIGNRIFNFNTGKSRIESLKKTFDSFVNCLSAMQSTLIQSLRPERRFPQMTGIWTLYEELHEAVDGLIQFHTDISGLKFIRDSVEHTIQSQMTDWVHYILICFEGLSKQLDRKSKLDPDQLRERSVQVTLVPPDIHLFFERLDQLEHPDA